MISFFRCYTWGLDLSTGKPNNWYGPRPWHYDLNSLLFVFIELLSVIIFILSLIYFTIGIISFLFTLVNKKVKKQGASRNMLILRGIIGMAIAYIFGSIVLVVYNIFGMCL
jgi:hypothetical protein